MSNDLVVFECEAFGKLEIIWRAGTPWFFAVDVARSSTAECTAQLMRRLLEGEKGVADRYTLGGSQEALIVSESGLYKLIFASRTPAAERFQTWVTAEVLPALRRDGVYRMPPRQFLLSDEGRANFLARPEWERQKYVAYLGRRFFSYEAWQRAVDRAEF